MKPSRSRRRITREKSSSASVHHRAIRSSPMNSTGSPAIGLWRISPIQFAGDYINQDIEITGTAYAPGFQSYHLSYGAGIQPEVTTEIASSGAPVLDGPLGVWNVFGLQEGIYTLELTVLSSSGAHS